MSSVWEKLGEHYSEADCVVGMMDATVNEMEGFPKINSFPTIKLYKKDGTEVS